MGFSPRRRSTKPLSDLVESSALPQWDDDGGMKTRTLMLLALVTGLAILAAGAIQILMAT
jgi:hypothetical protein